MLSGNTFVGKILRLPLALIPKESTVPILRGPLHGLKWKVGASNHSCWTGNYEVTNVAAFAAAIEPGICVYDVGANVGIYTLLASQRTGASGKVYSFEPVPRNLHFLRLHVALNQFAHCTVVDAAVSDREGTARFASASWDHPMGRLAAQGDLEVATVSLDDCVYGERKFRAPDVMKIDVEGAEVSVLKGADRVLSEFHPRLFVEIHGDEQHRDCREILLAKGYTIEERYGYITARR